MGTVGGSAPYAVTQLKSAIGSTSGPTTTSLTMVQMPDLTLSITTTGGDLLVFYWSAVNNSTTANVFLGPSLDGSAPPSGAVAFGGGTDFNTPSGSWHFAGVAAGTHTVAIQWNVDAGTGTANSTRRAMHVLELKR
jgi:hypothetical protein